MIIARVGCFGPGHASALRELHGEVQADFIALIDVVDGDDVGMGEAGGDPRLGHKPGDSRGVGLQVAVQDLDRDRLLQEVVGGDVHGAHSPARDCVLQPQPAAPSRGEIGQELGDRRQVFL